MSASEPRPTVPPLLVVAWKDPVVDRLGCDPRAAYVERFWLPLLGPTSTWLLRRFAREFESQPDGFTLDAGDAARSIGVGTRGGLRGPMHRAIDRCVRFSLIHHGDHDVLHVRRRLPPLTANQVRRLPRHLHGAHAGWQAEQRRRSSHPTADAHAARLARSLLDVGATPAEVEDQLRRWNFDDTAARRALQTANTSLNAAS